MLNWRERVALQVEQINVISGGQVKSKNQQIYYALIIIKNKQMKILLATDGSAHSKAMIKQFAGRTFAPNTKVRIISEIGRAHV